MTAMFGRFESDIRIGGSFSERETFRGEKRVIEGIDQQGRYTDIFDKLFRAALSPVIFSVGKAVQGCGVAVIKIIEVFDCGVVMICEEIGEGGFFCFDLCVEQAQEPFHIDLVAGSADRFAAGLKIAGY